MYFMVLFFDFIGFTVSSRKTTFFSRVDVQASLITALTTLCSTLFIYWIYYSYTLDASMATLRERTNAIYKTMEDLIPTETFYDINTTLDMQNDLYIKSRDTFLHVKDTAGVLYLYTAKQAENGEFVYVIDGLNVTEDFRVPGDAIEPEIHAEMRRALAGEDVFPEEIKKTSWGKIFVTYLPFHDQAGKIVGVLGVEFEAEELYDAYAKLMYMIPLISLSFCLLSAFIAFKFFRRISNPHYKDIANTDYATGLKNRNAYEVDFQNIKLKNAYHDKGIILIDLDRLKLVNDQLGHNFGDAYIKLVANILTRHAEPNMIIYRIGGDEFIVLVEEANEKDIFRYADKVSNDVSAQRDLPNIPASVSCGYAVFDKMRDKSLGDTIKRADLLMYQIKRERHKWILAGEFAVNKEHATANIDPHDHFMKRPVTDILTAVKNDLPINPS